MIAYDLEMYKVERNNDNEVLGKMMFFTSMSLAVLGAVGFLTRFYLIIRN